MLTRFSKPTRPKCEHIGALKIEGALPGALWIIPVVGNFVAVRDAVNAALHCQQCGEPFTKSILEKTKNLKGRLSEC